LEAIALSSETRGRSPFLLLAAPVAGDGHKALRRSDVGGRSPLFHKLPVGAMSGQCPGV